MTRAARLLTIDIGNSKAAAVLWVAGRERGRWRLVYAARSAAWRRAAWRAVLAASEPDTIVVASVAPERSRELRAAIGRRGGARYHEARWDDPWPFAIAIDRPQSVGIDRLANVAGMHGLGIRRGIAVDAGTAITIDVLRDGRFEGGLIVPGFAAMLGALATGTALLPRVAWRAEVPLVGRDTRAALRAGAYHTLRAGVAGIVTQLLGDLGPRARVVVTGGQGEWFAACAPGRTTAVPDLTILGLRGLASGWV
jgi:type III pantothenate kinase